MSAQKTESTTNEDILAAVDELFEALALTNAAIAALHKKVDRAREVNLETLAHCKRLVQKDEDMMRSMGIYGLVRRANEEREPTTEITTDGLGALGVGSRMPRATRTTVGIPTCAIHGCASQVDVPRDEWTYCRAHSDPEHPARKAAPLFEKIKQSPLMRPKEPT